MPPIEAASFRRRGPTDYLLGRVDDPGLAEAGDPLYRDMGKLTDRDREIAKEFLEMLAKKTAVKKK
jgi:hypothetical protein